MAAVVKQPSSSAGQQLSNNPKQALHSTQNSVHSFSGSILPLCSPKLALSESPEFRFASPSIISSLGAGSEDTVLFEPDCSPLETKSFLSCAGVFGVTLSSGVDMTLFYKGGGQ